MKNLVCLLFVLSASVMAAENEILICSNGTYADKEVIIEIGHNDQLEGGTVQMNAFLGKVTLTHLKCRQAVDKSFEPHFLGRCQNFSWADRYDVDVFKNNNEEYFIHYLYNSPKVDKYINCRKIQKP